MMYAKTANVKKTNINGIDTRPSNPSVRFVALVEPNMIKSAIKKYKKPISKKYLLKKEYKNY